MRQATRQGGGSAALIRTITAGAVILATSGVLTASLLDGSAASRVADRPFWSEEFAGRAGARPDARVWTTEVGNRAQEGWWNNELQYYTGSSANSSLDGRGRLLIQARKAPAGSTLPCWPTGDCGYTSARLTTEGTVSLRYGRADIYARVPTGRGLLPAIWMLGDNGRIWPGQGEIDIVEVVGDEPRTVYGTAHGPSYFNEGGIGGERLLSRAASTGFHLYSIVKQRNRITWLVDDKPYFSMTPEDLPSRRDWVFEQDMHLLLNVAVGGDWPGRPSASTPFPATMSVDYIRLYGEGVVNGTAVTSRR